jgi:hypothetical protein
MLPSIAFKQLMLINEIKKSYKTTANLPSIAVTTAFLESGYLPSPLEFDVADDGSINLKIFKSNEVSGVSEFTFTPGPMLVKIVSIGDKLVVHAMKQDGNIETIQLPVSMEPEEIHRKVKSELISFFSSKPKPPSGILIETEYRNPSQSSRRRGVLDDPLGYLPGHTPEGDMVGPYHPMFGEPRYDPIGPGSIGEPNYDHQVPPIFGKRPALLRRNGNIF